MAEILRPRRGRVNDNVERFTNVRTGAATDKPIAFRMKRRSTCRVLKEVKGRPYMGMPWYKVEQDGQRGFAVAYNIDIAVREGRVNDNVRSFTYARTGAGTDNPVAFEMSRGSTCTVLGEVKAKRYRGKPWYLVEQAGQRGYAVAYNVDIVPIKKAPLEIAHGDEKHSDQGITPGSDYAEKVTPHITYGEIAMFEEERRFANQAQCDICHDLCVFVERVRSHFGDNPATITSGHRPPAVNRRVQGASNSEHLFGVGQGALDFRIENVDIFAVQQYCDDNWPYSVGFGAAKGFVHLGLRPGRPRVRWNY